MSKAQSIVQAIMAKKQASQMTDISLSDDFDLDEPLEAEPSAEDLKQQLLKKAIERIKHAGPRSKDTQELD